MFQHYIVTRFNVRSKDSSGILKSGVSEEWMEERFKLFLNFCFPSVTNQSNQNFQWFVLFDIGTSEKNKVKINTLASSSDIFVPLYIDCDESIAQVVREEIQSRLKFDYVITSRLDNDDSLHCDYVASVQKEFNRQEYLALNFINGATLDFNEKPQLGYRIHANNPFISLIEYAKEGVDTVCSKRHGGWGKIRSLKQINNPIPLWLSVNHDRNIRNRYIGFGDVEGSLLNHFNINEEVLDKILGNLCPNDKVGSLRNMVSARFYYFLKVFRHKIRSVLRLIPIR